jgi:hypothetical protein
MLVTQSPSPVEPKPAGAESEDPTNPPKKDGVANPPDGKPTKPEGKKKHGGHHSHRGDSKSKP